MRARVSASSGPMWMNCDDVQQAVHPPHGTSAAVLATEGALHPDQPGGEASGRQRLVVGHVPVGDFGRPQDLEATARIVTTEPPIWTSRVESVGKTSWQQRVA